MMRGGITATRALRPPQARNAPRAAPERARSRLSTRSWRTRRKRLAPRAARTASSFSRTAARARSRLATLAQPMSNSSPTAASTTNSVVRNWPTTMSASDWRLHGPVLRVVLGMELGHSLGHHEELGLGLPDRDVGPEAPKQEPVPGELTGRGLGRPGGHEGHPQIGVPPGEPGGHDPDQGARDAVEDEGLVQHPGVGAKPGDPDLVAQHEHRWRPRLVVGGTHGSPAEGGHPEELERPGGDE